MTTPQDADSSTDPLTVSGDFVIAARQSTGMFVLTELVIYISQCVMFFFVAVLTSSFLRDGTQLLKYLSSKVENATFEIVVTMFAISATMGIICGIAKAAPDSSLWQRLADETLSEAPRTAYVFGSGIAGPVVAVAWFIYNNPQVEGPRPKEWLIAAFVIGVVGFLNGCAFAYAFKHKTQIKRLSSHTQTARSAGQSLGHP